MGWRISLYCIPKKTVDKYKNITQEEWNDKENIWDELQSDCIKYDTLTDVIASDTENKFSTKLFTNDLEIESDMYFGTISKEQFLNIIEDVRVNHIAKWFGDRIVEERNGKVTLGPAWTKEENLWYYGKDKIEPVFAMQKNQLEWNHKARNWMSVWNNNKGGKSYPNINLDLENKWLISDGWCYEYLIFDLIHILKIFDWENDVMVAIGG